MRKLPDFDGFVNEGKPPGHWYYESDGDKGRETHYVWRYNDEAKGGIERKDFPSKAAAFKFLDDPANQKPLLPKVNEGRVLPFRNEGYGFAGTAYRKYGSNGIKAEWDKMSAHVASRRDAVRMKLKGRDITPGAVRDFLDSAHGRHLADGYDGDPAAAWSRPTFDGDMRLVDFMRTYDPRDFRE